MASSAVHTFTDPDEYAAVFPATSADLTITGRGQFIANVTRIDLHRLWMLGYSDNLPRVKHSTNITGRTIIAFRRQPGPGLFFNGKEMHSGNIKQLGPGQSDNQQSAGLASVGVMSFPVEHMASVGREISGIEPKPPRDGLIVTPPTPAMAKLQRLHAAATYLAETAPEIIGHHEAARGLEQALIEAMVECLTNGEASEELDGALSYHPRHHRVASDMRLTAGVEHHLRVGRAVIGEEPGVDSSGGEFVDIAPVNLGWPDDVPAMKDQYRRAGRVARGFDHRDRVGVGRSSVGSGH